MNADPRLALGGGGFLQKVSNQSSPHCVSCPSPREHMEAQKSLQILSPPLCFALPPQSDQAGYRASPTPVPSWATGPPAWFLAAPDSWRLGEGGSRMHRQAGLRLGQIGPPAEAPRAWTRSPVPQAGRRIDSSLRDVLCLWAPAS